MSPRHSRNVEEFKSDRQLEEEKQQGLAEVRQRVLTAAVKGRPVRLHPDDVKAAFEGHEDEWAEVAQHRRAADAAEQRRRQAHDADATLRAETTRVLKEWDEDRRREAEAEARRRLFGIEVADGDTAEAAQPEREPVAQPAARSKAAKA